ncbi:S24 family peptidase [Spirosoma flavum]|uniref:S24 family peptidase n=1 Tax=Spirosoma flavum TaxID=2048557 RepID=A0ABW6AQ75_9BACT
MLEEILIDVDTKAARLVQIREFLKLNPKQFAEKLGENPSNYYQMEAGKRKIGKHKSNELVQLLHLNQEWFETGEGEMFTEESAYQPKPGKMIPAEKARLFLSELPEKDAELYIPYYDVEITAGRIELYFDDIDEIPEGYVYAPHYQGCVMCNVKGNSMYDLIYPGARLYVYHLPDRKYIDYGQIYLVVTAGLRVLKYIRKHPTDDSKVVLASHNPSHDTWDVEKVDILNLFLVKGFENQTSM